MHRRSQRIIILICHDGAEWVERVKACYNSALRRFSSVKTKLKETHTIRIYPFLFAVLMNVRLGEKAKGYFILAQG